MITNIFIWLPIPAGLASLLIAYFDTNFAYNWLTWSLWFPPILVAITILLGRFLAPGFYKKRWGIWWWPTIGAFSFAIIAHFLWLDTYPYMSIGDELRDGGLRAQEIAENTFPLFGYDFSQGMLSATLNSFLYRLFDSDVLVYRMTGTIITLLQLMLVTVGVCVTFSPVAAFVVLTVQACLPLTLFFARTQPLVSFSLIATTCLLFAAHSVWRASKRRKGASYTDFLLVGYCAGVSIGLHAAIRPVILVVGITTGLLLLWEVTCGRRSFLSACKHSFILTLSTIVGFGPQALFMPITWLIGQSKMNDSVGIVPIIARYLDSLSMYLGEPLQMFFQGNTLAPISVLWVYIVSGLIVLVWRPKVALVWLSFVIITLIPLTNSAITKTMLESQRMLPTIPALSIILAAGVTALYRLRKRWQMAPICLSAVVIFVTFVSVNNAYSFFISDIANEANEPNLQRPILLALRVVERVFKNGGRNSPSELCVYVKENSPTANEFTTLHVKEFFNYFFHKTNLQVRSDPAISSDLSLYVSTHCDIPFTLAKWKEETFQDTKCGSVCLTALSKIRLYLNV